ncbi:hypothetical protein AZE99_09460 [Sphingorhabdus sp. M41]|nr:hypothetical protein AZE99_09460 [Sphingorhabdus sp. M41]
MATMLDEHIDNQRSRPQRHARLVKLQLFNDRIGNCTATIRNITEKGAGIKTETQLITGESLIITIGGFEPINTVVRWYKLGSAGLEFETPFDIKLLQFNKSHEAEGIYKCKDGYQVFDRFKPHSDFRRPGMRSRR